MVWTISLANRSIMNPPWIDGRWSEWTSNRWWMIRDDCRAMVSKEILRTLRQILMNIFLFLLDSGISLQYQRQKHVYMPTKINVSGISDCFGQTHINIFRAASCKRSPISKRIVLGTDSQYLSDVPNDPQLWEKWSSSENPINFWWAFCARGLNVRRSRSSLGRWNSSFGTRNKVQY
jgi:hypothetical protein